MKVLFDCHVPFSLAHGGVQIQIEQTKIALEKSGVAVEPLRWWDGSQDADIIHFFGRAPEFYIRQAQDKGCKLVMAELLAGLGSRSWGARWTQYSMIQLARRILPLSFRTRMAWESFTKADALIALTPWEAKLMVDVFRGSPKRIHVIPNGVEDVFFRSRDGGRNRWLVCTATIARHKRVLELAQAAVKAQTPIWIIGKPHHENDPYYVRFRSLAKTHSTIVRFEGPISDRRNLSDIYGQAKGFVLLSTMESLSLSALEAAATGCPLLLSDLPWARTAFGKHAHYCPIASPSRTAVSLRSFYDAASGLQPPPKPLGWMEVAQQLKNIYESLLKTSS